MNTPPDVRLTPNGWVLAGIAVCCVLAGAFVGATSNAVNGLLAPHYFVEVMYWKDDGTVWRRSIGQGVFEGFLFGVVCSVIFVCTLGVVTDACCSFWFALKHVLGIVASVYLCWLLGGCLALGLVALHPGIIQPGRTLLGGPPPAPAELWSYAWVFGSTWGAQLGGFFCTVVGLVILRVKWRHRVGLVGVPRAMPNV